MAGVQDVLLMRFVPEWTQAGLAGLRVWTGATLFLRHGWEKQPAHGAQFVAHFPDPIGIRTAGLVPHRVPLGFRLRDSADDRAGDEVGYSLLPGEHLCGVGLCASLRIPG